MNTTVIPSFKTPWWQRLNENTWLARCLPFDAQQVDQLLALHLTQFSDYLHQVEPAHRLTQIVPSTVGILLQWHPSQRLNDESMQIHWQTWRDGFDGWQDHHPWQPRHWVVPTYYQGEDLAKVAQRTDLSIDQVIQLHSQTLFQVQTIGFTPGFAFLGDLPVALHLPRRAQPRTQLPAGTVAIAEGQSAIYPQATPGGWHCIGQTDFVCFDWSRWEQGQNPCTFRVGDRVQFVPRECY